MKKIFKKFSDIFAPKQLQELDLMELMDAFNDPAVRKQWLWEVCEELKRMNLKIDQQLQEANPYHFDDLCARRRAIQYVLEAVLSAKRQVRSNNPKDGSVYDPNFVTA